MCAAEAPSSILTTQSSLLSHQSAVNWVKLISKDVNDLIQWIVIHYLEFDRVLLQEYVSIALFENVFQPRVWIRVLLDNNMNVDILSYWVSHVFVQKRYPYAYMHPCVERLEWQDLILRLLESILGMHSISQFHIAILYDLLRDDANLVLAVTLMHDPSLIGRERLRALKDQIPSLARIVRRRVDWKSCSVYQLLDRFHTMFRSGRVKSRNTLECRPTHAITPTDMLTSLSLFIEIETCRHHEFPASSWCSMLTALQHVHDMNNIQLYTYMLTAASLSAKQGGVIAMSFLLVKVPRILGYLESTRSNFSAMASEFNDCELAVSRLTLMDPIVVTGIPLLHSILNSLVLPEPLIRLEYVNGGTLIPLSLLPPGGLDIHSPLSQLNTSCTRLNGCLRMEQIIGLFEATLHDPGTLTVDFIDAMFTQAFTVTHSFYRVQRVFITQCLPEYTSAEFWGIPFGTSSSFDPQHGTTHSRNLVKLQVILNNLCQHVVLEILHMHAVLAIVVCNMKRLVGSLGSKPLSKKHSTNSPEDLKILIEILTLALNIIFHVEREFDLITTVGSIEAASGNRRVLPKDEAMWLDDITATITMSSSTNGCAPTTRHFSMASEMFTVPAGYSASPMQYIHSRAVPYNPLDILITCCRILVPNTSVSGKLIVATCTALPFTALGILHALCRRGLPIESDLIKELVTWIRSQTHLPLLLSLSLNILRDYYDSFSCKSLLLDSEILEKPNDSPAYLSSLISSLLTAMHTEPSGFVFTNRISPFLYSLRACRKSMGDSAICEAISKQLESSCKDLQHPDKWFCQSGEFLGGLLTIIGGVSLLQRFIEDWVTISAEKLATVSPKAYTPGKALVHVVLVLMLRSVSVPVDRLNGTIPNPATSIWSSVAMQTSRLAQGFSVVSLSRSIFPVYFCFLASCFSSISGLHAALDQCSPPLGSFPATASFKTLLTTALTSDTLNYPRSVPGLYSLASNEDCDALLQHLGSQIARVQ